MKKSSCLILFLVLIFNPLNAFAQEDETLLYKKFDHSIGNENKALFNGPIFINKFISAKEDNFRFLKKDFTKGSIVYEGQKYFDIELKYDCLNDDVIVKPSEENDSKSIKLIKQKVDAFEIENRKFINLSKSNDSIPETVIGYYEQLVFNSTILLYVKISKYKKENLTDNYIKYDFIDDYHYLINYNNRFYSVDSKSELKEIFPKYKKEINTFYSKNNNLMKTQPFVFRKNLITYLNNLLLQ